MSRCLSNEVIAEMKTMAPRVNLSVTDTGRAVITGTVFVALASLIVPAFGVLSALIAILSVSLLVGFVMRPRIRITGDIPDRVVAGQTVGLDYTIRNIGRLPLYNLCVRSNTKSQAIEQVGEGQTIEHLGPNGSARVTLTVRALRRGHWQVKPPTCQSSFPFNLFRFGASAREEHTLVVLPYFSLLRADRAEPGRHACSGSGRLAGRMGLSAEYAGNRPFLPGDSLRTIDARAWARLSTPATKEYHNDLDNSAALILDTAVADRLLARSESGQVRELEAAVSLCSSIAFSINGDRPVDFLLTGDDIHDFGGQPRSVRLDMAQDMLAAVEPKGRYPSAQTAERLTERFSEISEAYFILIEWNKSHGHLLEVAENVGCHCTVLIVSESDSTGAGQTDQERGSEIRHVSPDDVLSGKIEQL